MPSPGAVLLHEEVIANRLRELPTYGPMRIMTREEGIPGVDYRKAWAGDEDQRPYAVIGYEALSVISGEDEPLVEVKATDEAAPVTLTPSQIQVVSVDHPHGEQMPLHGNTAMTVNITERGGLNILRWPSGAQEYDWRERLVTGQHPDHPEISMVTAYAAPITNRGDFPIQVCSLEEAMDMETFPRVFMFTKITDTDYVATSRIGYRMTRGVTVVPPKRYVAADRPRLNIHMIDAIRYATDAQMLELHLARVNALRARYEGTPQLIMSQMGADAVFLYATND